MQKEKQIGRYAIEWTQEEGKYGDTISAFSIEDARESLSAIKKNGKILGGLWTSSLYHR